MYIVAAPDLATSVQKNYKALSFWSIEAQFSIKLGSLSKETGKLLLENASGRENGNSMMIEGLKASHSAMVTGLNEMNRVSFDFLAGAMDRIAKEGPEMQIDLREWVEHNMSLATSAAVYGPMDPYRDPKIEEGLR